MDGIIQWCLQNLAAPLAVVLLGTAVVSRWQRKHALICTAKRHEYKCPPPCTHVIEKTADRAQAEYSSATREWYEELREVLRLWDSGVLWEIEVTNARGETAKNLTVVVPGGGWAEICGDGATKIQKVNDVILLEDLQAGGTRTLRVWTNSWKFGSRSIRVSHDSGAVRVKQFEMVPKSWAGAYFLWQEMFPVLVICSIVALLMIAVGSMLQYKPGSTPSDLDPSNVGSNAPRGQE